MVSVKSLLMVVGTALIAASPVNAQESSPPPAPAERSTLSGVYTTEQAARGRDAFLGSCKSCHAPESQTGDNFSRLWMGKSLLDLFKYVSELMPENNPGSLAPEVNADVVAYLLQLNAQPPGKSELTGDHTALKAIKVEPAKPAEKPPTAAAPPRK
jgi:S-disulfanyl-L-cysteine oxidoreductase SoxD